MPRNTKIIIRKKYIMQVAFIPRDTKIVIRIIICMETSICMYHYISRYTKIIIRIYTAKHQYGCSIIYQEIQDI